MIHRPLKWILIPLALLVSHPLWSQTKNLGPRDYPLQVCSSTPPTGFDRQCADQTTGNLLCINALGGSCSPNPTIASGTLGLPTAAVPANTCSATATTTTASGALPTDAVAWSFSGDVTGVIGYGGGVALKPKVWTTANAVNVKLCNETAASITPGVASINWSIPGRTGSPTVPTIQHHSLGGCTGGATTCTLTGQVIGATGDSAVIQLALCWNSTCSGNITPACTLAVADGTNTYTVQAASSVDNSTLSNTAMATFLAANATAGTYTITATVGGTGCSFNFATLWFVDVGPVATSPVDVQIGNGTFGNSGTAIVLASPGNAAYQNELVLANSACWNNQAINASGSFLVLDRTSSTYYANFYLAGPTAGAPVTFTASCAATSTWSATMIGLHN